MSYDTKEKRVLSCDTKENMDSTDSALDETVSWFLHECLSVCTRFSISVGFFFTYYVILIIKGTLMQIWKSPYIFKFM